MSTEHRRADWVLGAAVLAMGMLAGFFWAYGGSVMPGLADVDDRTFVTAMQPMITATEGPFFFFMLLAAPGFSIWALVNALRARSPLAAGAIVAALVLYGICIMVTAVVHIPLNYDLVDAGSPAGIADLARVVDDFEGPWVAWHIVRMVALVGAFAALVGAMLVPARRRPAPPGQTGIPGRQGPQDRTY